MSNETQITCPCCLARFNPDDVARGQALAEYQAAMDGFGQHRHIVAAYIGLFQTGDTMQVATRLNRAREVQKLFISCRFTFGRDEYITTKSDIAAALDATVSLLNGGKGKALTNHNYLKRVLIGRVHEAARHANKAARKDEEVKASQAARRGKSQPAALAEGGPMSQRETEGLPVWQRPLPEQAEAVASAYRVIRQFPATVASYGWLQRAAGNLAKAGMDIARLKRGAEAGECDGLEGDELLSRYSGKAAATQPVTDAQSPESECLNRHDADLAEKLRQLAEEYSKGVPKKDEAERAAYIGDLEAHASAMAKVNLPKLLRLAEQGRPADMSNRELIEAVCMGEKR